MTTATELLQQIADSWAKSLGGKIPVRIQLIVSAGGKTGSRKPYWHVGIGEDCLHEWSAGGYDLDSATQESERKWRLDGSPIEHKDVEKAKLRAKARELGLRIVEDV